MFIFLSVCSLLVPLSMILLGYIWKDNPPKNKQGISGYRTTMSRIMSIPIEISILFGNSEHPFPERKNMPFRSRVQPFI